MSHRQNPEKFPHEIAVSPVGIFRRSTTPLSGPKARPHRQGERSRGGNVSAILFRRIRLGFDRDKKVVEQ